MKNQEQYLGATISTPNLIMIQNQASSFHQDFNQTAVKCIEQNHAYMFCLNQKCTQKNLFTCNNFKCKCNRIHLKCQRACIYMALNVIETKLKQTSTIKQYIEDFIQQQITKLSNLREDMLKLISQQIKCINPSQIQTQFYQILQSYHSQAIHQFTGKKKSNLWEQLNMEEDQYYSSFSQIKKQLKLFANSNQNKATDLISKFTQIIAYKSNPKIEQIKNSTIIDTKDKCLKLLNFFTNKVNKAALLFKASQHNFSMEKYYQICGAQTQTIIICLTDKNKIIGGYTPLHFNPYMKISSYKAQADPSGTSFLFSLTTNQQFKLKNKQYAIQSRQKPDYIVFGNDYFYICDNANTSNSLLQIQKLGYDGLNYKDDKTSNLTLNGNPTNYFKIKEWEVIKVQFSSNQL